jgi:CheY-like chemotaxis protein
MKILVVDDEQDTRDLLVSMLGRCHAKVVAASSSAEAMALLREESPDAIISDVGMPDEDGYSFIQRVRQLPKEQGGQVPAIALTAYSRASDRRRALVAGFNMHVPKPIDPAELVVVLAAVTAFQRQR